jgi:flagellar motor switch protein FliM
MVERILSQDEVDALLSAVDRGELAEAGEPARDGAPASAVSRYDFRKPNRVSKDQLKMLQSIHETVARRYAQSLTTLVRGLVEVELRSVEQVTYGEFIRALSGPRCLGVFTMEPLKGGAVLDLHADFLLLAIERLLGGGGHAPPRVREFTEIERVLVARIAAGAMDDLHQAWQHVGGFDFRVDRTETNPQFLQLTAPSEVVIVVSFDVRMGEVAGPMTLVYPHILLEPVISKLNSHRGLAAGPRAASPEDGAGLNQSVLRVGVTLRGVLAEMPLSIRDVLALKPGDILCVGRPPDGPAIVELEGIPRFTASPGIANRHKALRLLSVIAKGENLRDSALGSGKVSVVPA